MRVRISPIALIKIIDAASQRLDREVGGFLIGKVEDDCLNIVNAETPRSRGSKTYVEIDPLDMAIIAEKLEREGREESIVGWWHSHPGFGAGFMSSLDIDTQRVYQSLFDKAVALIIDPTSYVSGKDPRKIDLKMYRVVGDKYEEAEWHVDVDDVWKVVEDGVKMVSEVREEKVKVEDLLERILSVSEFKEELTRLRVAVENFSTIRRDLMQFQTNVEMFMLYSIIISMLFFIFVILMFLSFM